MRFEGPDRALRLLLDDEKLDQKMTEDFTYRYFEQWNREVRDRFMNMLPDIQRKAEAIGPTFYEHRRRELTDELAIVLRMQREATGH